MSRIIRFLEGPSFTLTMRLRTPRQWKGVTFWLW